LDYVLEREGSATQIGIPVAFIETAWRRYTKHSRNKAQEIQEAILPLITTHRYAAPFFGAILAGVFTDGALDQMRSLGFAVLYFAFDSVVAAFNRVDIDAFFDEGTPDEELLVKVRAWEALDGEQRARVSEALFETNMDEVRQFMDILRSAVTRHIDLIRVLPLHGTAFEWNSVRDAIEFMENYEEDDSSNPIVKYELEVRFNNGDQIEGKFADKESAIQFLRSYQPPELRPSE
jgi:hypothetical protein